MHTKDLKSCRSEARDASTSQALEQVASATTKKCNVFRQGSRRTPEDAGSRRVPQVQENRTPLQERGQTHRIRGSRKDPDEDNEGTDRAKEVT